ncbi:hypothetical protein ABE65_012450 [Fictibacillus phosphorivorans]|uniref:Uncharacterized protein n=1 Tax=Fictibacillus phosphorivorans TaxID=1221500 RepID=A0A160IMZ7_9BACL|nr:hypothetical protein [Fictibacillus phosphorivorans]ANC77564.1 hypothetical protein ABE65_012450 [Fictibacillus phosphorivorans]
MKKYLPLASITIFVLTILILSLLIGKVTGQVGTNILFIGVITSILTALMSKKGGPKTTLLIFYGLIFVGFLTIAINLGKSGL